MAKKTKDTDLLNALFTEARREAQKRKNGETWSQKAQHLRTMLMPIQARLERDPSRWISVRSPRQTGKSTGVMLIVAIRCLEKAGAEWIVVGLTRPSVKRIYWSALKELNKAFELDITFQHQELVVTFKNGSKISFVGAENISEIEKFRGGRYDGVVIDEAKSFGPQVFRELIEDVVEPAVMAKNGQLFIIGTPGDWLDGPFYLATCEEPVITEDKNGIKRQSNCLFETEPQYPAKWSLHSWNLKDNITLFERPDGTTYTMWDQALVNKAVNGWGDDHPTWRREYLGHWVADDYRRVWHYRAMIHDYTPTKHLWGLPEHLAAVPGWKLVLGADPGTMDGTGFVLWAYHPNELGLWEVYSEKRSANVKQVRSGEKLVDRGEKLTVGAIARWYKELEDEFGTFEGSAMDPAGLATMVIDTLGDEYGVYFERAEKKDKLDIIELMNNDFDAGLIHVRRGSPLSQELAAGKWDEKQLEKGKHVEDRTIPNDVSDAGLYAFRWANHRRYKARAEIVELYSQKWWIEHEARELEEAKAKARERGENLQHLDTPWWS